MIGKREVAIDELGARLALLSALRYAEQTGRPSAWSWGDWLRVTRTLGPPERAVVAMHAIRGQGFEDIGAWFGFSRARADQLWRRALKKMRADRAALAAV